MPGLCWMWQDVPFARQRRPAVGVLRLCWLLLGSFDCFCRPRSPPPPLRVWDADVEADPDPLRRAVAKQQNSRQKSLWTTPFLGWTKDSMHAEEMALWPQGNGIHGSMRRGGGSGTQHFVYQKWPDKIIPTVNFVFSHDGHFGLDPGGATTTGPDATPRPPPPSYLPKLAGGLGWGGSWGEGGGAYWQLGPGGGGLRVTHYYHMHTSRGCVCLGAWGYRGMYGIIAISSLCQEESLKGIKDQRHSTPFN